VERLCRDAESRFWLAETARGLVTYDGSRYVVHPNPEKHWMQGCATSASGALWLYTEVGLFLTPRGSGPPRRVASQPPESAQPSSFFRVLEDRRGRLWAATGEQICSAAAADVARDQHACWQCQQLEGARGISALLELGSGTLWAGTDRSGVWQLAAGSWSQIPASRGLASLVVNGLASSAGGRVWILGHGGMTRVQPRPDLPEGWEVVENLTSLQGVPSAKAEDLVEEEDGSLWVATVAGLVRVPVPSRRVNLPPPRVKLVDLVVDGERVAPERIPRLAHRRNLVELHFAALSYRDRSRLRYRFAQGPMMLGPNRAGARPCFVSPMCPGEPTPSKCAPRWTGASGPPSPLV
jgi:ligand-binding sensor domain-containing protein